MSLPTELQSLNIKTCKLSVIGDDNNVLHVEIASNRVNSMTKQFWHEYRRIFETASYVSSIRCILVSGSDNSKAFCAGIDLQGHSDAFGNKIDGQHDIAREAYRQLQSVKEYQATFTAMEEARQPVIVAISGPCVGAGVDLITAADIRLIDKSASFTVKEVDIGLAADVGTLQRLPKVIGNQSLVRELCYTCRPLYADEALQCGLVSRVYKDKRELIESAKRLCVEIASKSPVAVTGTKHNLNYSRDHSVREGLEHMQVWNGSMLQSSDMPTSIQAFMSKQKAIYSNL